MTVKRASARKTPCLQQALPFHLSSVLHLLRKRPHGVTVWSGPAPAGTMLARRTVTARPRPVDQNPQGHSPPGLRNTALDEASVCRWRNPGPGRGAGQVAICGPGHRRRGPGRGLPGPELCTVGVTVPSQGWEGSASVPCCVAESRGPGQGRAADTLRDSRPHSQRCFERGPWTWNSPQSPPQGPRGSSSYLV